MTLWTKQQLDALGDPDEIEIAPRRDDGRLGRHRPIWIIRLGDDLYVRSYRGASGSWYRTITRTGRARVRVDDTQLNVQLSAATGVDRATVDSAYRTKYGASSYVDAMVAAAAAASTLRLAPDHQEKPVTDTTDDRQPSGAERMFGDFAPALVRFTDDVLFGDVWKRPDLSPKERSLITVAALTALGNTDQLVFHLDFARRNGNTDDELIEAITHLAFYTGWPKAMAAMTVAKRVLRGENT